MLLQVFCNGYEPMDWLNELANNQKSCIFSFTDLISTFSSEDMI
jgi:hypothetical protein